MKNLLLIASFLFIGACQNYATGDARHQCCSDAMANGKTCECCDDMNKDVNASAMSAGATESMDACCADAAANGKSCCAEMVNCDSAAAASCPEAQAKCEASTECAVKP